MFQGREYVLCGCDLLVLSFLLGLPGRRFLAQLFQFISFPMEIDLRCAAHFTNKGAIFSKRKDFRGRELAYWIVNSLHPGTAMEKLEGWERVCNRLNRYRVREAQDKIMRV